MASAEILIRDYLRSQTDLMTLLDNNPTQLNLEFAGPAKFNHVTIRRDGEGQNPYVPLAQPIIVLHCYGSDRDKSTQIADLCAWYLRAISNRNDPLLSCDIEGVSWAPTADGVPMNVVTALVTARIGPLAA